MKPSLRTIVCLLMLLSLGANAQTKPEFEVASIKPAAPDARGTQIRPGPGGGITITNMTLKEMMTIAWRVQPFQVSGGPAWLDSTHYDVIAKPETKPRPTELPLMLQSLLEDRFQLVIHRETRELPIYELMVARKDGKLGPGLTESKGNGCTPPDPNKAPSPPKPGDPSTLGCGGMMIGLRELTAARIPVANLAQPLGRLLGRTVVDKTSLTGRFDVKVEWTPDETQALRLPPGAPAPPPSETAGPSIFTAFREQLGLRIESRKGPVEILVVERAEKPSEN